MEQHSFLPLCKHVSAATFCSVLFLCYPLLLSALSPIQSDNETNASALPPSTKTKVDFWRDVSPILREKCQSCHNSERQSGGLRLDNRASALAGGSSGPVIEPGNSAGSKLIRIVAGLEKGLVMPLTGGPLTPEQIGLLRAWIDQGVEWPEPPAPTRDNTRSEKPPSGSTREN